MDYKERSILDIREFLDTRQKSYLESYASGDVGMNSKLLTDQFIKDNSKKRVNRILWTIIPDLYLGFGAYQANSKGYEMLEAAALIGLGLSVSYAVREAMLIASQYFFINDLENEVARVLSQHRKPVFIGKDATSNL